MAQKKTTPQKRVYRVDISCPYSYCVYVKAESPEAAKQLADKSAVVGSLADERGEWGVPDYTCYGIEYNDVKPDIGGDDEEEEPAEDDRGIHGADFLLCGRLFGGRAVIDGIVASMVPIPGKDFKMGKFPVTQAQWEAVMGKNPSKFKGADRPVEQVSWDDCQKFLKKLNASPAAQAAGLVFRLPEEDEWEFACRAGAAGDYCKLADGTEINEETLGEVAWCEDNSGDEMHPVGLKEPNAIGLYDMHGNVWEWTATACDEDGNVDAAGVLRVYRGGSWISSARDCGSSARGSRSPSYRSSGVGFRLCASGRAESNDGSASRK